MASEDIKEALKEAAIQIRDEKRTGANTALRVGSLLLAICEALSLTPDELEKIFLRKDQPDTAAGLITFLKGLFSQDDVIIGTDGYAEGMTGFGTKFGKDGSGEMSRLTLRHELRVPSIVFNQVEILVGDKWRSPGAGVIETVFPDYDDEGRILNTGSFFLKLEKGQIGAVFTNAICMGIFHNWENTDTNATVDADDSRGNRTYAGFTTSYFTITEVSDYTDEEGVTYHRKLCRYQIRPVSDRWSGQAHPFEQMNFVCYGIFSDDAEMLTKYGTSVYETRTYRRMLWNQNTWEIGAANIAYQDGDLSNLNIHGMNMKGYSAYLNSVYFTGTVKQVKPDGTPVLTVNDRGEWAIGTMYDYYDRVSHNGGLWLCVNESGTNTEPKDGDPSWLCQVKPGSSVIAAGHWKSSKVPYPANSVVTFADKVWISNKETSAPPFCTYTDKEENRLVYKDGGYVLVETLIQSEDWNLLLDAPSLTNGQDGESLQVRYSADKSSWHQTFVDGDIWMQQRVGDRAIWSDPIRIVGEAGAAGVDGTYYDYQFAVNESLDIAPATGWQDTPPSVGTGQYLWMRTRLVDPNSEEENPWSVVRIGGEKGDKGDSVSNMGAWRSGMAVPYLGMVTMGRCAFLARQATDNPPLWCWTDKDGNRFTFDDDGYILTGEVNASEYELLVQNGKDGADGKDFEYIYIHSKDNNRPSTPNSEQTDDYVPTGWHDDPIGVSESLPYEWVCVRTKRDGIWSEFSTPALWAKFGKDGIDGLQGIQGERGEQGIPGENGKDGQTSYFHIKYADDANGSGMNETGGDYIGTYVDFTPEDSADPSKYTWVKTKGAQGERGEQGIAGTNGANGETSYLHIAYANSADGKEGFSVSESDGKLYIGQYTDFEKDDSTDPTRYKWTLIKGEKGEDGAGFTLSGNWKTGLAVPAMGVVSMGGSCFAAIVATVNPPLWCWTDKDGNRFTFNDGGYILTGEGNAAEYQLWSISGEQGPQGVPGADGADGKTYYTWIRYADDANGTGISNSPTGKAYIGFAYNKTTATESNTPSDYKWSKIEGEQGVAGEKGADGIQYYTWIAYSDNANGSGMYQQPKDSTKYIGIAVNRLTPTEGTDPSEYTWSLFRGADGEGFTTLGKWKTGLAVPTLGVVSMGGGSFVAKVATNNPPLWCWTDKDGNRIIFKDGSYILTGDVNTAEYDRLAEKGEDGKDGVDGLPGEQGKQGIQGCIIRDSEWALGTQYRNDESLTSGTRYVDVALVRNDSAVTGWDAYKCKVTHTSTANNAPGNTTYWEEFGSNVGPVFTSLIIAKNAKIRFLQGNQLVIQKSSGAVTAGLSGSTDGDATRIWAGGDDPDSAPFAVNEQGVATASKFRTARSGLRLEASNGLISVFGSMTKNIEFGMNDEGLAVMRYYDNDGTLLYDLGPSGISSMKRATDTWKVVRLTYVGSVNSDVFGSTYWPKVKSPVYSTGENRYQFLSGFIGNVYNDAANNRKYFKTKAKTDADGKANYLADGWYVLTLGSTITSTERMQWVSVDGSLPSDMQSANPPVSLSSAIYAMNVMHIQSGAVTESMNVYFN